MQTHESPIPENGPAGLLKANRWLSKLEDWFTYVASISIFLLMLLGIWQVLGRQIFNMPVPGYIDLVELSMATFAFLAVSYCQRLNGHVRMDLFVRLVHGRARWIMEFLTTLLPLFLMGVLIYFSWEHFLRAFSSGDSTIDMEYPVWPSKLMVPLAFSLLFLRLLIQTIGFWRLVLKPDLQPILVPLILTEKDLAEKEIEDSKSGA
ncbi:MAG: TRAP transporter small permease [Burkholderiales bacterium]|jgi:C4-dicarboxylate transporter, DctQ subunit|nr:TRAP transporter small permease [Burkholderiales bacterium]